MVRNTNWKTWVILGVAVAVLVTSSGLVMASNMGFKINRQIYQAFLLGKAPKADNWLSIPHGNPYPDAKKLCTAFGTTSALFSIAQLNVDTGGTTINFLCSQTTIAAIDPVRGVRIRSTITSPATVSGVMVGASNEAQTFRDMRGGFLLAQAPKKDNWIAVPYHSTWVKAEDACVSLGLTIGSASIVRIDANPASTTNLVSHPCATTVNNFSLVIGEAVSVRKTSTVGGNCDNAGGAQANGPGLCGKLPPHF